MSISAEEYRNLIEKEESKDPKNQIKGKANRELGKAFEDKIEEMCKFYELSGMAKISKTPEPMKILKHLDHGRFEATFAKSAEPDFKGTIKGGQTIVFDAKFTNKDRINYSVLKDHQRESLLQYKKMGAESFILVGFVSGSMYKIDIDFWNDMKAKLGRQYIKECELDRLNFKAESFL